MTSPPRQPDYRLVLVFDPANDRARSQTTAWTDATGPSNPRIERLFRELFPVILSEQQTAGPSFS